MLPFHSLYSDDRTFIPDFCFKILSLTNCGKALELSGKDFSQDSLGSSDCPSEESEASLVIFLGQTRGRIQGQTRGQKAEGPKAPKAPRLFGLWSGLGCGLWFALGKSLGKLQTLPKDSLRTRLYHRIFGRSVSAKLFSG